MLIVRGVNLYPSQIEHVLLGVEGVAPHYQLVVERARRARRGPVRCEPAEAGVDRAELAAARPRTRSASASGVGIDVELVAPGAVPRSEGKAVRVIDRRVSPPA